MPINFDQTGISSGVRKHDQSKKLPGETQKMVGQIGNTFAYEEIPDGEIGTRTSQYNRKSMLYRGAEAVFGGVAKPEDVGYYADGTDMNGDPVAGKASPVLDGKQGTVVDHYQE